MSPKHLLGIRFQGGLQCSIAIEIFQSRTLAEGIHKQNKMCFQRVSKAIKALGDYATQLCHTSLNENGGFQPEVLCALKGTKH